MKHGTLYKRLIQSREWRELRVQVLREQPLCQWCKAKGYITAAREIHHIVEAETGRSESEVRDLMFRRSNLVALCHECHAEYHKAQHYHSTEAVKQRQQERMKQWEDEMINRFASVKSKGK